MLKPTLPLLLCVSSVPLLAQDISAIEKQQLPGLVDTYKSIHAHPELSHFEEHTSALVATELRKAGYTVTDHIGVYPDGSKAFGVVGILKNGSGPTLLVRAAGTVGITSGPAMASATSVDVTIRGIGGHGAQPFYGRDPIVLAANYILQLQTIVSRELDPRDSGIVTVGDIHGGTKRNIIPDEVKLELTVRAFSEKSRQEILSGLRQMAIGVATSAGLPPDKMPTVTVLEDESTPALYNDPALAGRVKAALQKTLGPANVFDDPRHTASEDVGIFGLDGNKIPVAYFWLGAMYPDRYAAAKAAGKELPGPHTSKFEPDPEPTLETGVKSLTAVALSLLQ